MDRSAVLVVILDSPNKLVCLAYLRRLTSVPYLQRYSIAIPPCVRQAGTTRSRYARHLSPLDSDKAARFAKLRVRYIVRAKSKNKPILPARSA